MRGMSSKAKFGWALALSVAFLLVLAVVAAQPSWGKHPESRVHCYMIAFACDESRLDCIQLLTEEFDNYDKCWAHLTEIRNNQDRYAILNHPLVLGKCISWSPPLDNIPVPAKKKIETWIFIYPDSGN